MLEFTNWRRLRFDEGGRGRGIEGRKDVPDGAGYVQGYVNKDSYDKSHWKHPPSWSIFTWLVGNC